MSAFALPDTLPSFGRAGSAFRRSGIGRMPIHERPPCFVCERREADPGQILCWVCREWAELPKRPGDRLRPMLLSRLEPMEAEPAALHVWIERAARSQEPIELHVTPRGWDLRCGDMPPFDFHPTPALLDRHGKRPVDPATEDSTVIPDRNAHRELPDGT